MITYPFSKNKKQNERPKGDHSAYIIKERVGGEHLLIEFDLNKSKELFPELNIQNTKDKEKFISNILECIVRIKTKLILDTDIIIGSPIE
jgi:hypothetical protein